MAKDDELDPSTTMTRIIKDSTLITEVVEQQFEEMFEDADDKEE